MLFPLVRSVLFRMEPERAHDFTLAWLERAYRLGLAGALAHPPPKSPRRVMGLEFPNPVGLAAGLDKNGDYIDPLGALGFGFLEIGTVTPRPQPGNPRPRLFRLPQARALINRLGFNNSGVEHLVANARRARYRGVLGINIGKNRDTPNARAADDYLECLRRVYPVAGYVTVNVSSPNTEGLRELQEQGALAELLTELKREQARLAAEHGRDVPLAVKVSPDLEPDQIDALAGVFNRLRPDAVVATNTTLSRDGVQGLKHAAEAGGLSGAPLRDRATRMLEELRARIDPAIPLIGLGGIVTGADAQARIRAGAALVQVYTGFVYRGPQLIGEIGRAIDAPDP